MGIVTPKESGSRSLLGTTRVLRSCIKLSDAFQSIKSMSDFVIGACYKKYEMIFKLFKKSFLDGIDQVKQLDLHEASSNICCSYCCYSAWLWKMQKILAANQY